MHSPHTRSTNNKAEPGTQHVDLHYDGNWAFTPEGGPTIRPTTGPDHRKSAHSLRKPDSPATKQLQHTQEKLNRLNVPSW